MNTMQAAVLEPVGNGEIALQGVTVDATLRGLLSEVTVTQTYENLEATNIEAVYTFPLPLDAVLMELTLELNGEILRGEVKPKNEAEADYEDAIEEGDSAVLLTQVQPGLFSVNVGNLLAGEKAKLRFRYAQLHRWQGDSLRFHLPTTLAPRYGNPAAAGLREHEMPEQTLTANYGFCTEPDDRGCACRSRYRFSQSQRHHGEAEGATAYFAERRHCDHGPGFHPGDPRT